MLSTRLASVSLFEAGGAPPSFHSLPRPLKAIILLLVPIDTRLRCTEVSCAWRALLADTIFWECLDFDNIYDARPRSREALFVAAVAKANGQLCELDVSSVCIYFSHTVLLNAVNASSQTLQRLRLCSSGLAGTKHHAAVAELCTAAPSLQRLDASVSCDASEARALLRREPPFGALNMCTLVVNFLGEEEEIFLSRTTCSFTPALTSFTFTRRRCQATLRGMLWLTQPFQCNSPNWLCHLPCSARGVCLV